MLPQQACWGLSPVTLLWITHRGHWHGDGLVQAAQPAREVLLREHDVRDAHVGGGPEDLEHKLEELSHLDACEGECGGVGGVGVGGGTLE